MTQDKVNKLTDLARRFRIELIQTLHAIQTGHPGGSLSCAEILTVLYFDKMNVDPANPGWDERDRLVLSKGHAAPMLYIALAHRGFFSPEELKTLRQINSRLQGHPCADKTPGVDISSGSLGLGLGSALGLALSERMKGHAGRVFVVLGDGELDEGAVWESAMATAKYNPGNLVAILDHNGVQLDGANDDVMPLGEVTKKFEAFGWKVVHCDGHDIGELSDALDEAMAYREQPVLINALTVKGKGISFMEGQSAWHGKAIGDQEYELAMAELIGSDL